MSDFITNTCSYCKQPYQRKSNQPPGKFRRRKYCSQRCSQYGQMKYPPSLYGEAAERTYGDGQLFQDGRKFCTRCAEFLDLDAFWLKKGSQTGRSSICRKCYQKMRKAKKRAHPEAFKKSKRQYDESPTRYLSRLHRSAEPRAKRNGQLFTITLEWLRELLQRQDGRCFYSGELMTTCRNQGRVSTNISIDRKDSRLGYVPENVVLCCFWVNVAKAQGTVDDILMWASRIQAYREKRSDA